MMAGLHRGHLEMWEAVESPLSPDLVRDIFGSLTNSLAPRLPAFTALLAMIEQLQAKQFGVLEKEKLVRLPLSVVGTDRVRYRTPIVEMLHESILSLRMSEWTVNLIKRQLMKHYKICLIFLCSCGVVVGRCQHVRAFYGSDTHQAMDMLRSAIDAEGNRVELVSSLEEIPVPTMDLAVNGAEKSLFDRIQELTKMLSLAGQPDYPWIEAGLQAFVQIAKESGGGIPVAPLGRKSFPQGVSPIIH